MSIENILSLIQSRYPDVYVGNKLSSIEASLANVTGAVKKCIEDFLESNNHNELNVLGYSVESLISTKGMNEIAAYLTLDWIIREPEKAIASLKRGNDLVGS